MRIAAFLSKVVVVVSLGATGAMCPGLGITGRWVVFYMLYTDTSVCVLDRV